MKKNYLSLSVAIILSLVINQYANAQTCAWAKKAGGTNGDFGMSVAADASGNVYYLGDFYSATIVFGTTTLHNQPSQASNFGSEMFLVKYDSCGNFKWAKQAGGKISTRGTSVTVDGAGNVYVTGYSNCDTTIFGTVKLGGNKNGYNIGFLVKYDPNGNALWAQQVIGYDGAVKGFAVTKDISNNVYVTGDFSSSYVRIGADSVKNEYGNTTTSVFIAKFNNSGAIQWVQAGCGDYEGIGYGIGADASGNVYVAGTFGSTHIRFGNDSLALSPSGYYDIFVVKYNTSGTEQWLRTAGGSDDDEAMALASDANGNVFVTGYIGGNSTVSFGSGQLLINTVPSKTVFLVKYNTSGTTQWVRGTEPDNGYYYSDNQGYNVTVDASGNPYIIGFYSADSLKIGPVTLYNNSLNGGGGDTLKDIFVAKYKSNGILSWARTAGDTSNDFGYGIATEGKNLYITGEYMSPKISFAGIQ
ncbi:MAG TPA: SBBP repeat-containing protein, partial [Bacteroidia bacterium]